MTSTRTVPELTDRGRLMWTADPEVIGMTTRAVGLIGRRAPGDQLAISTMTVDTVEPHAVVARIGRTGMIETRRQPILCAMAAITGERRREMPAWSSRRDHSVVTRVAGTGYDRHMVEASRDPAVGHVAELAVVAALNMPHVLAHRDRAVVTAEAIRSDSRMVEVRRR